MPIYRSSGSLGGFAEGAGAAAQSFNAIYGTALDRRLGVQQGQQSTAFRRAELEDRRAARADQLELERMDRADRLERQRQTDERADAHLELAQQRMELDEQRFQRDVGRRGRSSRVSGEGVMGGLQVLARIDPEAAQEYAQEIQRMTGIEGPLSIEALDAAPGLAAISTDLEEVIDGTRRAQTVGAIEDELDGGIAAINRLDPAFLESVEGNQMVAELMERLGGDRMTPTRAALLVRAFEKNATTLINREKDRTSYVEQIDRAKSEGNFTGEEARHLDSLKAQVNRAEDPRAQWLKAKEALDPDLAEAVANAREEERRSLEEMLASAQASMEAETQPGMASGPEIPEQAVSGAGRQVKASEVPNLYRALNPLEASNDFLRDIARRAGADTKDPAAIRAAAYKWLESQFPIDLNTPKGLEYAQQLLDQGLDESTPDRAAMAALLRLRIDEASKND